MIPTRVSHNPSIGPGVVPFGVDPAYDAQYKLNQAPRSHVASHGQGKPFTVEPGPHQRTQYPYVTGTTVLGCKYKDGVMLACDTLCKSRSTSRASTHRAHPTFVPRVTLKTAQKGNNPEI